MKVLVACEYSGTVRRAFAKMGHELEAWCKHSFLAGAKAQHSRDIQIINTIVIPFTVGDTVVTDEETI